jgi:hypothetical protein
VWRLTISARRNEIQTNQSANQSHSWETDILSGGHEIRHPVRNSVVLCRVYNGVRPYPTDVFEILSSLVGCDALSLGSQFPTFRRIVFSLYSVSNGERIIPARPRHTREELIFSNTAVWTPNLTYVMDCVWFRNTHILSATDLDTGMSLIHDCLCNTFDVSLHISVSRWQEVHLDVIGLIGQTTNNNEVIIKLYNKFCSYSPVQEQISNLISLETVGTPHFTCGIYYL